MDIKLAAKTVNQELKKLKTEVSNWHVKREEVFDELKASWQSEQQEVLTTLKKNPDTKNIIAGFKSFENFNDKTVQEKTKKLLAINTQYSVKTKELAKVFGDLAEPYLKTVKEPKFGVGVKAEGILEQELTHWIADECFKDFDADSSVSSLNKKLSVLTKDLSKPAGNEQDHLKYMAKMELFCITMISNLAEPLKLSRATRQSLENNSLLSPLLYELEASISIQRMDQALNGLTILKDSVSVEPLVNSYGTAPDEASLKRSKSAMKGVRESFGYFTKYFEENTLEDIGNNMDGMNSMYLNDIMDHLKLGKACLINNASLMSEYYDMDTASRDLMSDSLHDYLNSDKFFDKVKEQKKAKKKIKA